MKNEFTEVGDNELCPCNSGKAYKKCCKKKNFKWGYEDGVLRKSVPLKQVAIDILEEQKQLFINLYGRMPQEKEYAFPFMDQSNKTALSETAYAMRKAGIAEYKIYAFYRSDGLIPCKENEDLLSDADLQEFSDLCNKYNTIMSSQLSNNSMNSVQYVSFANNYLIDIYENNNLKLNMTMNDFIRRHNHKNAFCDYELSTAVEYCIFSLYKTIKILKSIKKLQNEHMTESIYALSRGLFENYMYINAINHDENFFDTKILPKIDSANYSFVKFANGKINYNQVVHRSTGEKSTIGVKIADLKKYFVYLKDEELYELFYKTACQYIHVDVLSAKSYFYESDIYDEIDPSIVASIISITLAALLIYQISHVEGVDAQYTKDFAFLFHRIRPELLSCFEIANSDPQYKNAVYNTFIERLNEEI